MNRFLIVGAVLCCAVAARANEAPRVTMSTTGRIGSPIVPDAWAASPATASVNPEHALGQRPASPVDDPVLDVLLPKQFFNAGESVVLTTHLRGRDGTDIDGAEITVTDNYSRGEQVPTQQQFKGQARGHGRHAVTLDTTPGEHFLTIAADGKVHGNDVHRATSHMYTVATGSVAITDVGKVRSDGAMVTVPLSVTAQRPVYVTITATLAAKQIAVAHAQVGAWIDAGASTLDLAFRLADLVEPGPYRVVHVMAMVTDRMAGPEIAAVPDTVGHPFNINGGGHGHEPPPLTNERGEVVGGPYGNPNTPPVDAFAPRPEDDPPQPPQLP